MERSLPHLPIGRHWKQAPPPRWPTTSVDCLFHWPSPPGTRIEPQHPRVGPTGSVANELLASDNTPPKSHSTAKIATNRELLEDLAASHRKQQ